MLGFANGMGREGYVGDLAFRASKEDPCAISA
jgi:hypothetical protein